MTTDKVRMPKNPLYLREIKRIDEGLHEIVFDVTEHCSMKLTIKGALSLEFCSIERISTAA